MEEVIAGEAESKAAADGADSPTGEATPVVAAPEAQQLSQEATNRSEAQDLD